MLLLSRPSEGVREEVGYRVFLKSGHIEVLREKWRSVCICYPVIHDIVCICNLLWCFSLLKFCRDHHFWDVSGIGPRKPSIWFTNHPKCHQNMFVLAANKAGVQIMTAVAIPHNQPAAWQTLHRGAGKNLLPVKSTLQPYKRNLLK